MKPLTKGKIKKDGVYGAKMFLKDDVLSAIQLLKNEIEISEPPFRDEDSIIKLIDECFPFIKEKE